MITSAILYIIYAIVWALARLIMLFPKVSVDSGFGGAISTASTYIGPLDKVIPVGIILTIVGLVLSIEIILAGYKIIMWVIRRIPTQS